MSEPEKIKYQCIYCNNFAYSGSIMPPPDYGGGCKGKNAIDKKHLWTIPKSNN